VEERRLAASDQLLGVGQQRPQERIDVAGRQWSVWTATATGRPAASSRASTANARAPVKPSSADPDR
jgi:hypothetical protein